MWQAATFTGMQHANEPGAVCWNENMVWDLDGNKAFYQAVFGYQYDDRRDGEFQYTNVQDNRRGARSWPTGT